MIFLRSGTTILNLPLFFNTRQHSFNKYMPSPFFLRTLFHSSPTPPITPSSAPQVGALCRALPELHGWPEVVDILSEPHSDLLSEPHYAPPGTQGTLTKAQVRRAAGLYGNSAACLDPPPPPPRLLSALQYILTPSYLTKSKIDTTCGKSI